MTEKPICLFCGKPLRKKTYGCEVRFGERAPATIYGKTVAQVVSRTKLSFKPGSDSIGLWCGEWGGYGDNFFCGLNCGYGWAVMRVEMSEKERPGFVSGFRDSMKQIQKSRGSDGA